MGLLFTKLMTVFGDREHKVIIVGLDNAGKTTILYQFLTKEAVHTSPTIGSNVEEISVRKTRFLVWDVGGQESLRASWNSYYCNTEIVILVVDSTDRERLTLNKDELHRMLEHENLTLPISPVLSSDWCLGPTECCDSSSGQQAGHEGLYDSGRDLPVPHPQLHYSPLLACTGLLCPHRGGTTCQSGLDEVSCPGQLELLPWAHPNWNQDSYPLTQQTQPHRHCS
uniref:ADP-ribosylation factor-like protein 5C n=1 Tax=Oncorhynchus tshawytscha TaxID=74940 RepID=A0A8C8FPI5_ONCTS